MPHLICSVPFGLLCYNLCYSFLKLVELSDKLHRDVEGFDRVCQRADGNDIHAGFLNGTQRFERNTAGGLDQGLVSVREWHRLMVVEY